MQAQGRTLTKINQNLVDPDLSSRDLSELLKNVPTQYEGLPLMLPVSITSNSGPKCKRLRAPDGLLNCGITGQ